ncbi:MAG: hypothetical protein JRG86_23705 [Deltaproteobacteria bacterium]|nr:hypothetical protein [Deltaproteobacteria bacterium]MBW2498936.1 hypothetical protein [Deltaproteobacteria bacterium]
MLSALLACASPAPISNEETPPTPAGVAIVSVEAYEEPTYEDWVAFAERIKEVGRLVDDELVPAHAIDRAEGYRYLLATIAEGIFEALYGSDLEDPQFRYHISKFSGEAMPSSDARYQRFEVDGRGTYRIWGQLGNAAHITLQAYSGVGARETFDLETATDEAGRLSIVVGGAPRDGSWEAMSADSELIQLREYFSDWENATRSHLFVERLDGKAPRGLPTDPADIAAALERAVLPLHTRVPYWKQRMDEYRALHDNSLSPANAMGDVGLSGLYYGHGWFDLADDEALLIEFEAPDARHWSYQLGNYWSQTVDWANFTSSTNGSQARASRDGRYRLVVAHTDPGVPNWLDTAGHPEGLIFYRYHDPVSRPIPTARLVKLSELREHLPADTPAVTPDERAAEIEMRRSHKRRRWQP